MLEYLFFPNFSKKCFFWIFQLQVPPTAKSPGGIENLKIMDFELGDRFRVVRWSSYLVGMWYRWVLQVGNRSDSSDNSTLQKITILGRRWNQTAKWPITTPEPKIEILDSPDTLECSDHHTVSTCGPHEYYRLSNFHNRPTTFHPKNLDSEDGDGSKLQNVP